MSQALNLKSIRQKYRRKNNPTMTRIAQLAGISTAYLSMIVDGKRIPPTQTEDKILDAYQQAWEELKK